MANQELLDFIKQSRDRGQADQEIRERLKQVGWQDRDVAAAFKSSGSPAAPPKPKAEGDYVPSYSDEERHEVVESKHNQQMVDPPKLYGKKRIIVGILMIVLPIFVIIAAFTAIFAIVVSMFSGNFLSGPEGANLVIGAVIAMVLAFLAMVTITLALPTFGIAFLAKKDPPLHDGMVAFKDKYLSDLSLGAFFGNFIWAFASKLYVWGAIMLVVLFIPLIGQVVNGILAIILIARGRQKSWDKGWPSLTDFKNRQRLAAWIILAVTVVLMIVGSAFGSFLRPAATDFNEDSFNSAFENIENDPEFQEQMKRLEENTERAALERTTELDDDPDEDASGTPDIEPGDSEDSEA